MHKPGAFVGTTLQFRFQCVKCTAKPDKNLFPAVRIVTRRVQTLAEWQQHEVRLNGVLVGTIDRKAQVGEEYEFVFSFQPQVLRVAPGNYWELPPDKVNHLSITLGLGGFGLEDSFDVMRVQVTEVEAHYDLGA